MKYQPSIADRIAALEEKIATLERASAQRFEEQDVRMNEIEASLTEPPLVIPDLVKSGGE